MLLTVTDRTKKKTSFINTQQLFCRKVAIILQPHCRPRITYVAKVSDQVIPISQEIFVYFY